MNNIELTYEETTRVIQTLGIALDEFVNARDECTREDDREGLQEALDETNDLFELLYFRRQQANPAPSEAQMFLAL